MKMCDRALGIAQVHQQTIPEILRDRAVKALNDCGGGFLIGADYLTQIFRIELAGEERRVHQVTEHHCELAPLGVWGATFKLDGFCLWRLVYLRRRL